MLSCKSHNESKSLKNGSHISLPITLKPQDWRDELEWDCTSGVSACSGFKWDSEIQYLAGRPCRFRALSSKSIDQLSLTAPHSFQNCSQFWKARVP